MANALDIYDEHREQQLENGSFSETFVADPNGTPFNIKGVFDQSFITENRDAGGVRQMKTKPRILVATINDLIVPKVTEIIVRGELMKIQKTDLDTNGIPRLWLI